MKATALIDLAATSVDGLMEPMPLPCQSLILRVEQVAHDEDQIDLGVRISTGDVEFLTPGTARLSVRLDFWDDVADVYIVPGTSFTLRYPSRIVGQGRVLEVLQF